MLSIMGAQTGKGRTLSEAARLLEEPQHRLIYLCIGKYQSGWTNNEIDTVMKIAGPTIERLPYC